MVVDLDYLKNLADLSVSTNSPTGELHAFNPSDRFYGYPSTDDYEVWYDFDLGVSYTQIQGQITWYPCSGSAASGCTSSGANPDTTNFDSSLMIADTTYSDLGVSGEGNSLNKAWIRWGKPGKLFHALDQLPMNGQNDVSTPQVKNFPTLNVVGGPKLRWSGSSESGSGGNERWAFDLRVLVK